MGQSFKKEILSWFKSLLFAVILVFICQQFIFTPMTVLGSSMQPTFTNKEKVIVSKTSSPKRFDIVTFHAPGTNDDYIKRVIGLPGDHVKMQKDMLFINGKKYNEPYLKSAKSALDGQDYLTNDFDIHVPDNTLFVLGDNRKVSNDSRIFGTIQSESVIGVVKCTYYPLKHFSLTNH